jgi:GTP-binding protein
MVPVIALVGRPNVGKSTLFNRLTKTRDALVAEIAGLTRDRKYGEGKVGDHPFIVIDTAGISGEEKGLDAEMANQSFQAISEADIVFFMVDAQAGLLNADRELANYLRKSNKEAYLVVNKIDGRNPDVVMSEFHELSFGEPIPIAAAHNRGVNLLVEYALEKLNPVEENDELAREKTGYEEWEDYLAEQAIKKGEKEPVKHEQLNTYGPKIAIVGRPNVGKSTLVNRLLGEERVVVYDHAGTTRDSIYIPYKRNGKDYTLIDTAGVRRRKNISEVSEKFSIIKALQAIQDCNVCVLVLDARDGIVEQDLHMLSFVVNSGRALVIAINKWDGMTNEEKEEVKRELDRRLDFMNYADRHFISALHGTAVGNVYESVDLAYQSAMAKWSTSELTRILEDSLKNYQPPLHNGRRIKLRYAHQGGSNPPVIVVHGNKTDKLQEAYRRYLANTFRRVLDIHGTPIRFQFKTGTNPFVDKKEGNTPKNKNSITRLEKTTAIRDAKHKKMRVTRHKKNK